MSPALISLLATLAGVTFAAVIGLIAWIVQSLSRTVNQLGVMEERSEDHERRLGVLEAARATAERERWRA